MSIGFMRLRYLRALIEVVLRNLAGKVALLFLLASGNQFKSISARARSCIPEVEAFINGSCIPCACPNGFVRQNKQLNPRGEVPAECPECVRCPKGTFSEPWTENTCIRCSTPCGEMNRNTLLTCNGASDRRCGSCLKGFYMAFHHDEECVSCRNDRLNRPECVTYRQVVLSTTHSTSKMPIDREQTITISGLEAQREGKSEILTSVVLVLMAVAIICAIVLIFVKSKKGDHDSTRTDKTQDNPWGSTSTRLDETDLEADCILLRENLDENDRVELNAAFDVAITRDDPLLLRVAKHIDNEPEEIFEDLGIPKNIFFQTEKNICIQVGSQIADVYYGVLQKWVERSGRAATKRVLFRAFEKFGMASVCQVLIDDTKTF